MVSLSFSHPEFLVLLILLPLFFVAHRLFYSATKKHAIIFSNFETLRRVRKNTRMRSHIIVFGMRMLALVCLVLALAQPVVFYDADRQPTDYVLAIDTSASMSATDLQPTRFEAAQQTALDFVDVLGEQTSIGVIGFSGYPFVASVLTNDTDEVRAAIRQLDIQAVSGTDISGAITTGTNLLLGSPQGRAIVLITDGSSTTGQANVDSIAQALGYARSHLITVHAIGIGEQGSAPTGYLPRLYNVSAVFDQAELERITNETNGELVLATNQAELEGALQGLLEAPESRNVSASLAVWFILAALLLIFVEWSIMNARLRIIP